MRVTHERAPAKVNLCLFVGPARADGRHELVSVMDNLDLADDLRLEAAPAGVLEDVVVCPGVEGPNLAASALAAFRARTGWDGPRVRLTISKRIPVAGGMAGGSADAAAALRLIAAAAGMQDTELLVELAIGLGSDVPSQVHGGPVLVTGGGETVRSLAGARPEYSVLVLPASTQLSTGAVYAEADRLGLSRDGAALAAAARRVDAALLAGDLLGVLHNDLQDAARSLCPAIDDALDAARRAGADHVLVSGSGPTVLGLVSGADHALRAARAHDELRAQGRRPDALLAGRIGPDGVDPAP